MIGSTDTKRALHTTCDEENNYDVDNNDNDSIISVYVGAVSTVLTTIIITRTSGDVGTPCHMIIVTFVCFLCKLCALCELP